ncbi:hypothetical protein PVK06_038843 [Gossypium arboreum]|uniref:Uncharacterized protein n=1 Tax=Gossypium arboreum TaxID=29729 RepID=A0ABR0N366_GOSAR|nr:hypothetical protein PVK06_038843 [Gossypium arboreum]
MDRFQLFSLVLILLLLTPRIQAIRRNILVSSDSSVKGTRQPGQQVFHPGSTGPPFTGQARQFEEKRRVPTGSNPLHNKR